MSNTAIVDHAFLSDRHSAALVDRSGSVEWLTFPRFDSPSVFGRLLGSEAGHWSVTPGGPGRAPDATWTERWYWRPPSPQHTVSWS
jgi:alpha,alpha-trehalase